MSVRENEGLALAVIEALNTRDLSQWSQKLSDNYAGAYPGAPLLNKTQSIGYNERVVIALPRSPLRGPQRRRRRQSSLHTLGGERHPNRAARHRHGKDHPTDQAKGDGIGCLAHRGEGRQDCA
jgi:hypothetical protein